MVGDTEFLFILASDSNKRSIKEKKRLMTEHHVEAALTELYPPAEALSQTAPSSGGSNGEAAGGTAKDAGRSVSKKRKSKLSKEEEDELMREQDAVLKAAAGSQKQI